MVETEDGHRIALPADGVGLPRTAEPIADLRENVSLTTAAESYAWGQHEQSGALFTGNLSGNNVLVILPP